MKATRAGAERITYGEVRAEARLARDAEQWHKKNCPRCGSKATEVYQRCDDEWELAKRVHRAEYALAKFLAGDPPAQGTLW